MYSVQDLKPEFLHDLEIHFDADVLKEDEINSWVSEKTNGRIPQVWNGMHIIKEISNFTNDINKKT